MAKLVKHWWAAGLLAAVILAAGIGVIVSAPPAGEPVVELEECVGCEAAPKSKQEQIEAQSKAGRQQALAYFNTWHGTKVHVPDVVGENGPVYAAAARVFEGDLPAPEKRVGQFARLTGDKYKCVGWSADIVSVTPNDRGWEATIHVRPELAMPDRMLLYTPYNTVEKWQIAPDGTATVLDVHEGDGLPIIIAD